MKEEPVSSALVIGGGSFGTALALVLARKGAKVQVWVRDTKHAEEVNTARENTKYLANVPLPDHLTFTSDLVGDFVQNVELILFAIPTQFLRSFLERNRSTFPIGVPLVQSAKGVELSTLKTPYEIMMDELPGKYGRFITVLAGPSFASEMARNLVTNVCVAGIDAELTATVQRKMSCRAASFRCYSSDDVMGCEIAGAVKNVLAIASGAGTGLGLGNNARAALICRGLNEIGRLAKHMGSNCACLPGLAGVGDLMLTCSSELSRNFTVGMRIAKGETLASVTDSTPAVAEGVATAKALEELSKKIGVELPICHQVYLTLYEGKHIVAALTDLQDRPLGEENTMNVDSIYK